MSIPALWSYLDNAPRLQLVFIALFLWVSIIGSNAAFIAHSRRIGRYRPGNPFLMLTRFNVREWSILATAYLLSGLLGGLAMLAG